MAESKATLANWRAAPHNRWAFHHRSHWYILEGAAPLVAQLSSQALPVDVARIGLSLRAVSRIRQLLAQR